MNIETPTLAGGIRTFFQDAYEHLLYFLWLLARIFLVARRQFCPRFIGSQYYFLLRENKVREHIPCFMIIFFNLH